MVRSIFSFIAVWFYLAQPFGYSQTCTDLFRGFLFEPWYGVVVDSPFVGISEPVHILNPPHSSTKTYRVTDTDGQVLLLKTYKQKGLMIADYRAWKFLAKYNVGFIVPEVTFTQYERTLRTENMLGLDVLTFMKTDVSSRLKRQIGDDYNAKVEALHDKIVAGEGLMLHITLEWRTIRGRRYRVLVVTTDKVRVVIRPDQIIVHPETLRLQINDPE
jgi:hypothetical protein